MNTVDNVIEKINEDTALRVRAITDEAFEKAQEIKAARLETAQEKATVIAKQYEKEAAAAYKRVMSGGMQKCRGNALAAKRAAVSRAFDTAYEQLCAKSDGELVETMASMAAGEIKTGKEELLLSPSLSRLCGALADAVKGKNPAFSGKCSVSERVNDIGVVIKCGDVEQNKTFGAILREKREALEADIVNILF